MQYDLACRGIGELEDTVDVAHPDRVDRGFEQLVEQRT